MISSDSNEWIIPQHKIIKKLDLMEVRIMKLASEVNNYKEAMTNQNVVLDNLQDTVDKILHKINTQEQTRDDDLKIMVEEIKKSHDQLQDNLSSVYFKQRRDNIFWRSYNNKFSNNCNNVMGFGDVLFSGSEKLGGEDKNCGKHQEPREKPSGKPPTPNEHTPVLKLRRKTKVPLNASK
jgi:hypothetical protein